MFESFIRECPVMQVFAVYLEIVDTEVLKELKDIPVTLDYQVLME